MCHCDVAAGQSRFELVRLQHVVMFYRLFFFFCFFFFFFSFFFYLFFFCLFSFFFCIFSFFCFFFFSFFLVFSVFSPFFFFFFFFFFFSFFFFFFFFLVLCSSSRNCFLDVVNEKVQSRSWSFKFCLCSVRQRTVCVCVHSFSLQRTEGGIHCFTLDPVKRHSVSVGPSCCWPHLDHINIS